MDASSQSRNRRGRRGLRFRLLVLVALVILPLGLVSAYRAARDRDLQIADAKEEALELARKGAAMQEDVVDRARNLLQVVSHVPDVHAAVPGKCDSFLEQIRQRYRWQIGLWVVRPDGSVSCSTVPGGITLMIDDRPYFRKAMESRAFTLSDYLIVKLRPRPAMVAVLPVMEGGAVGRLMMATLDPAWITELVGSARADRASVSLVDGQGDVLARYPERDAGQPQSADPHLLQAIRNAADGFVELTGDGGTVAGFARIANTASAVVVSMSRQAVVASADAKFAEEIIILIVVSLLVGLAVWIGGEMFVLRWIDTLAATARRLGGGALDARAAVPAAAGELHTLATAINDMADRLAARERDLVESDSRLRGLAANMPGLAYQRLLTPDGQISLPYVSEATRDIFGIEPAEAQADPARLFARVHPDDLSDLLAVIDRATADRSAWSHEFRVRADDGSTRWLKGITTVRQLPDAALLWDGLCVDITEQKQVEAKIRESEAHFATLARNVPGLLFQRYRLPDGELRYTYFSEGITRIAGCSAEDALRDPRTAWKVLNPDDAARIRREMLDAEASLSEWRSEYRYIAPSGEERWMAAVAVPRRREDGRLIWDGLAIDVTDRKRAEAELVVAKDAAEAANRAKSDFLASMSHELRTPLNSIIGFADLLIEHDPPPDERMRYLRLQREAGRSLGALINDILDFSKIEAGRLEIQKAGFDLHGLADGSLALVRQSAEDKGLAIELAIDPRVPTHVRGDADRLRQVLLNLLSNAVKFTHQGRIDLRIAPAGKGDGVLFLVSDTGIGIPADKVPFLFHKFSPVHASGRAQHGGTGLGLAISKRLTELMGGGIGVDSMPGRGSSFWFELPLEPAESPAAAVAATARAGANGRALNILVAEDVPMNQMLIETILTKAGHAVTMAPDGQMALELARERSFDLVLMDLQMPIMDGFEATRAIRALTGAIRRVPIVALTANAGSAVVDRCLDAGMDGHLSKPIDCDKLFALLERIVLAEAVR